MLRPSSTPHTVELPIDSLRPHPRQSSLFGDISDAELRALAEDMRQYGQRDPIHVTTDGIILAGHQRVRALESLGIESVLAVQHDISAEGSEAVALLINDNICRRQLSPMTLARCCASMWDILGSSLEGMLERPRMRDDIAVRLQSLGVASSGRTLDRLRRLTSLPREIQDAIDEKRITRRDGEYLRAAKQSLLDEVAEACGQGRSKSQLREIMGRGKKPNTKSSPDGDDLRRALRCVARCRNARYRPKLTRRDIEAIDAAAAALEHMKISINNQA